MAATMMKRSTRILINGLLAGIALWLMAVAPLQAAPTDFDHLTTGFPLTGGHARLECETCHLQGVFKGTPRECERCHIQGSQRASTFKPTNHVQTTRPCFGCHTSNVTWLGARFDHIGVVPGGCPTCHNSVSQTGKPTSGHPTTTLPCDSCHRTTAWLPAYFDHAGVTPHTCTTCHGAGGSAAVALPARHLPLGSGTIPTECDWCHRAGTTWTVTTFSHQASQGVVPGGCNTCHNGSYATGKGSGHPANAAEMQSCDVCHKTYTAFTFSHTQAFPTASIGSGNCLTCHIAGNAQSVPGSPHPATGTESCDDCHKSFTAGWPFTHPATASSCSTCHYGAGAATHPSGSHFPTTGVTPANACEVCHTSTTTWTSTKRHGTSVVAGQCNVCHSNAAYRNSPYNVEYQGSGHTGGKSCDDAGCHQHTSTNF